MEDLAELWVSGLALSDEEFRGKPTAVAAAALCTANCENEQGKPAAWLA